MTDAKRRQDDRCPTCEGPCEKVACPICEHRFEYYGCTDCLGTRIRYRSTAQQRIEVLKRERDKLADEAKRVIYKYEERHNDDPRLLGYAISDLAKAIYATVGNDKEAAR